jgi:hypothetical protein
MVINYRFLIQKIRSNSLKYCLTERNCVYFKPLFWGTEQLVHRVFPEYKSDMIPLELTCLVQTHLFYFNTSCSCIIHKQVCYSKRHTFAAIIAIGMWTNAMSARILTDDFSSTCQLDRMSYVERRKPLSSCTENSCTSTLMNLRNREKHITTLRVFECVKADTKRF